MSLTVNDLICHGVAGTILSLKGHTDRFTISVVRTNTIPGDLWPHDGSEPLCWATVWLVDERKATDMYFRHGDQLVEHGTNTAAA